MDDAAARLKQRQRLTWAAGDYHSVSRQIQGAADALIERLGPGPGDDLLDVATGTGNVAVPAAGSGARVTGLDLTPELLALAGSRADAEQVQVTWVEGDAEALPFDDASFDMVASCFGVIFAPRHALAAAELARVTRPGGAVALTAWTPEGLQGRFFRLLGSRMSPPPPGLGTPLQWGVQEHVRSLLEPHGAVTVEHRSVAFTHDSLEGWLAESERTLGPLVLARAALEPPAWQQLRSELLELYRSSDDGGAAGFSAQAEYLLVTVRIPA